MSEAPESTRVWVLAAIIPPLVHRLNNLLAVAGGHCDIWSDRTVADLGPRFHDQVKQVRGGVDEVTRLIRAVSMFSKDHLEAGSSRADVGDVIQNVTTLVVPFANERGVSVIAQRRGGQAVYLGNHRRLTQGLITLLTALIGGEEPPPSARFTAYIGKDRLAISLTVGGSVALRHGAWGDAARDLAGAVSAEGWRLKERGLGQAASWRVVLPAETFIESSADDETTRGRVVLLEPDQLLADLVSSVLSEEGHRVQMAAGISEAAELTRACDVLLVDRDVADEGVEALASLIDGAPAAVILGNPAPGDSVANLAKPFRPTELLDAVARALGAQEH